MEYDVYVVMKDYPEYILTPNEEPIKATSDMGLLDIISSLYMDEDQKITRSTPIFNGEENINIVIYPRFEIGGLAFNKKTHEIRRVKDVGIHWLDLFNTDDKYKADLQRNGYILSKHREVQKEDWIPISENKTPDNPRPIGNIYHPGSVLGKDKDFDRMEYEGMMSL